MPALIDITNQKFNKLLVLERANNIGRKTAWKCQCDCGNMIVVTGDQLKNGKTKSCGCLKGKDLIGLKFNRLTVIEKTPKRTKDRNIVWKCKCDCGNECYVDTSALTSHNTKSCGCLNNETRSILGHSNKKDLTGQRFGKLVVIKDSGERYNNNVLWLCLCDCGAQIKIKGTSLLHGVESCGCVQSKGEEKIATLLRENNIPFEIHKKFDNCKFENGYYAYFDFYVNQEYIIEYDGIQHFEAKQGGWNTEENLQKTQIRDQIKNNWCKQNNIPIIRIPYIKLKTLTIDDLKLPKPTQPTV